MIVGPNGAPAADSRYPKTFDDLKEWGIVTASSGEKYIGKLHNLDASPLVLLQPAYEYHAQNVLQGEDMARRRVVLPIEMMPRCESIRVRASVVLKLDETTDVDRQRLFGLIKTAQDMVRSFLAAQSALNIRAGARP